MVQLLLLLKGVIFLVYLIFGYDINNLLQQITCSYHHQLG